MRTRKQLVPGPLRAFAAATVLLTRIPISTTSFGRAEWKWAPAWFPIVGAGIGAMLALVWRLVFPFGALVAGALVLTAGALITGAIHEDGLADTADALGGGQTVERVFEILKDSRVGSYGALAIALSVVLRIALLASIPNATAIGLVAGHCAARTVPAWLLATLPYVTPPSVAKSSAVAQTGRAQAVWATVALFGVLAGLVRFGSLRLGGAVAIVVAIVASATLLRAYYQRRVGGVTGDLLGAAEQVCECAALMAFALMRKSA